MLYLMHEGLRQALLPSTLAARATAQALNDPLNPWAGWPATTAWAAACELFDRLGRHYAKPEFAIDHVMVDGKRVAVEQEQEQVNSTAFCRLLRFRRMSDDANLVARMNQQPTILVVAPLSGHHATLLRDTVRTLLVDHQVLITDWVDASTVPLSLGSFGLDDYVKLVERFIAGSDARKLHVFAVCQPVVPVMGAVARLASAGKPTPASMILMGGPVDARQSPTSVNSLATDHDMDWFRTNLIHAVPPTRPGAGRLVYPGFLQHLGFVAMNPERHAKSHWEFFQDLVAGDQADAQAHRQFYDEYNAVLDMPAEYYLQTIQSVFKDHELARGTWYVDGERVDPSAITKTALMTIEGGRDDIAGQGQTRAAHALCTSIPEDRKVHLLAQQAGHYGLFSGGRWRDEIYPRLRQFVRMAQGD